MQGDECMLSETRWVRNHSHKLSPKLRREILDCYQVKRWLPCFIRPFYRKVLEKFRSVEVIIQNPPSCTRETIVSVQSTLAKHNCRISKHLPIIDGFAGKLSIRALSEMISHEGIKKVWLDRGVHTVLDVAAPVCKAPPTWDLGFTGAGVTVAVVDTGIYPHADLTKNGNRISAFYDLVNNRGNPYDDNGHGTHIAGCIAGDGFNSGGKYRGTAPKAQLVGVKVLDREGSGKLSTVIAGIQWCLKNKEKFGIRVINLSLGSTASTGYTDDPLCKAVESAWQAGIVVCAAAGNEGPDPQTIDSPGIDPMIITVGATDDNDTVLTTDDLIASYSSRGPTIDGLAKPDLFAPGTDIVSLTAPGSYLAKELKDKSVGSDYLSMSGTSMATPLAAGVAALIIQLSPGITPDQVKLLMTTMAQPLFRNQTGENAGLVDALESVQKLRSEINR